MKKLCSLFLIGILLLTACQKPQAQTSVYYDLFDTYCRFTAYGLSTAEFETVSEKLHAFLLQFHQETDIYHPYDHITNLYSINHAAGEKKLTVSDQLMAFLYFCQDAYTVSQQRVNVMLGAVTALWHLGREQNTVPDLSSLTNAKQHTQITSLQLDADESTVYISDPLASLDVGALAKGYAGRLAVAFLKQLGVENFLLDLGGNLCAYGAPSGRDQFTIGLQDPSGEEGTYACTKQLQNQCAVTSGDYQRFYEVEGIKYHHIIDPDTLFPSVYHHSVTVIHEDSAMADLLSTALFLLPEEEGTALAESYDAVVIYLD
ncbi:MAG: FAD:protein FMN transferase [Lachnospiraceae bacterium]|nr:FAD:protein FMN transferase [Lachnospiraceae bacterium]